MRLALFALLLASACVKSETTQCGVITCGPDTVCSPSNDRCVTQTQLDACSNAGDGDGCTVPGISAGVCSGGACLSGGCGNGILETASDELCDDGNLVSGDGCRADCKSTETCGDGVINFDAVIPETCDCGTDASNLPFGCSEVNSSSLTASCRPTCQQTRCGDGVVDLGEVCDDGNTLPGDGCRADCQGRWTEMQSPTLAPLFDVDAVSPTNAWAVGIRKILHWDGIAWTAVDPPPDASQYTWTDVLMLAPDHVLVLGSEATTYRVYRHFQGAWAASAVQPGNRTTSAKWTAFATNGTATYVVGTESGHVDLGSWLGTAFGNASTIFTNGPEPRSVAVSPNGTRFFTADNGNVYKDQNLASWTFISGLPGREIFAPSDTSFWLFNLTGSYHSTTGSTTPGEWSLLPGSSELSPVFGADATADLALAVGQAGAAILCTPSKCEITRTGTMATLNGVALLDDTHAFIVGNGGTILY